MSENVPGVEQTSKRCSKCKTEKPRSEFHKDRAKKDGLRSMCRDCQRVRDAAQYAANAEKERAYAAAYRAARPEYDKTRAANRRRRLAARTAEELAAAWLSEHPNGDKVCEACGIAKPAEGFAVHRSNLDGRQRRCRPCAQDTKVRLRESGRLALVAHWTEHGLTGGHLAPAYNDDGELLCVYGDGSCTFEHIDHVQALSNGGPDDLEGNGAPACAEHNGTGSKGARPTHEYLIERMEDLGDRDLYLLDPYALVGAVITDAA